MKLSVINSNIINNCEKCQKSYEIYCTLMSIIMVLLIEATFLKKIELKLFLSK